MPSATGASEVIAASLQDSSLAVMLRRFEEGINAQRRGVFDNHPEYQFRSDLYMTYHDQHIEEYRLMRNAILDEVTDAAGESTKIPKTDRGASGYLGFSEGGGEPPILFYGRFPNRGSP